MSELQQLPPPLLAEMTTMVEVPGARQAASELSAGPGRGKGRVVVPVDTAPSCPNIRINPIYTLF